MHATDEQITAIDQAKRGDSFKIMAYAGSGKTTTLKLISDTLNHKKGLYLAFNKAIADDAKAKFPAHVDCRTFHSLAFRHVDRQITDKLRLPRQSPIRLAEDYRLEPISIRRMLGKRRYGSVGPYSGMMSKAAEVRSKAAACCPGETAATHSIAGLHSVRAPRAAANRRAGEVNEHV